MINYQYVKLSLFALSWLFTLSLCQAQVTTPKWFIFKPENYFAHNTLSLKSWIEKPAGKHGYLYFKNNNYIFTDGTQAKFWGVNIAGNKPFMPAEEVQNWTQFLVKYGINAVRFHKFTWHATDGYNSTSITESKWRNFDYLTNELRDAGIYYGWSHIYGHKLMPGDSTRVLAYSEVRHTNFPWSHLNGTTASLVNFAEDLQQLNIELTVNMLQHINPNTGLRYADDPALIFIEIQNEDNIFWAAIEETLKQTPTYRALLCRKFSTWLKQKYENTETLMQAWKGKGLEPGQTIEALNIYPNPNHGLFTYEYELAIKEHRAIAPHIKDRIIFLLNEQQAYYDRFTKAIRDTGYKGVIIGSCWQAGAGMSHLMNLYSDYRTGPIDRHNYFGGGTGHTLTPGKFKNEAMVKTPGSGLLSTSLQQVANRPFQLSEWMSLIPNEWVAESAPIVAAYGMGLQGWDASFSFAMDNPHYSNTIQNRQSVYNVTSPTHLALYPALALMIYRKDLREGDPVLIRHVNPDSLQRGILNHYERVNQEADIKDFKSDFPLNWLAVGKVLLAFDSLNNKEIFPGAHTKRNLNGVIHSNTEQLKWDTVYGNFTINTAGTKAFVGFSNNIPQQLGSVSIQTSNKFAVIFISSLDQKPIEKTNKLLITTVARARNTNMAIDTVTQTLVAIGSDPILLEPVNTKILIPFKKGMVYVLDHTGNRTTKNFPFTKGRLFLDGEKTESIYYEIVRKRRNK